MGYSTKFEGTIGIEGLDINGLRKISALIEDNAPEDSFPALVKKYGGKYRAGRFYYLDVELTGSLDGIKWNGSEKTGDMVAILNLIQEACGLTYREGDKMTAQGEEWDDRYEVVIVGGVAVKRELPIGKAATCPRCDHQFELPEEEAT